MGLGTILALILVCCGIEIVLTAADFGLVPISRLRARAYEFGGFWPGLLSGWRPNYPGQPAAMFFTYGFLHGGLIHLAVNMVTLWSLGSVVVARVGAQGFGLLYGAALFGGGAGFGLLAADPRPMVGASGALFGLAGGMLAWDWRDRRARKVGFGPLLRALIVLLVLNVVLYWAMVGQLAWETHLGGFVAGWVVALILDPQDRRRPPRRGPDGREADATT